MRLRTQSRAQLSTQFGYLDAEGRPSERAIANILRAPLSRWGLSPKRDVLKHARAEFRAGGVEDVSGIPRVLRRLVDIGECEEVYVGHELYLAPTRPRWIPVGEGVSAFLGASEPPDGLSLVDSDYHDIVRRLRVGTDEEVAILELAGVQEVSLSEWLVPPGYLRHASRRMRQPARSDAVTLGRFWDLLEEALTEEGLTVSADAEVRFLGGVREISSAVTTRRSLRVGGRQIRERDCGVPIVAATATLTGTHASSPLLETASGRLTSTTRMSGDGLCSRVGGVSAPRRSCVQKGSGSS